VAFVHNKLDQFRTAGVAAFAESTWDTVQAVFWKNVQKAWNLLSMTGSHPKETTPVANPYGGV